ncbi:MAG: FAD-binding oxidoreductase [Chloroflexi bacterium]|nr:FAD-binding oxidoreductase [Chloroflexota bacterium]
MSKLNGRTPTLPADRLARVENFGHSLAAPGYVFRPTHAGQVADLFKAARKEGFSIGLRGAGRSYGDAAINRGQAVLDLSRMRRALAWDPQTGILKVEPGFTIQNLWQYTLEDGWWGPVMPGTMFPTLGGCLAANIHGKNNWQAGPIGEHVLEFTALLPNGKEVTCTPKKNADLFHAMIGGMGLLGVFTSITLQLKKVYSGYLDVHAWAEPDLERVLAATDENKEHDYIVGWVDCTAGGRGLGRGQMHSADYLPPGADPDPAQSLRAEYQALSPNLFGILPRSVIHQFMKLAFHNPGMRLVNTAKYTLNRTLGHDKRYPQTFVAFNFLLDYVPDWERGYGRGGLIQYQTFLPKEAAADSWREMLRLCQRRGLPSYLGVVKRHRPDKFLLSHALDGFSLALDFKVTDRNRHRLRALTADLNRIALEAGGRFYFAKDSTLSAADARAYLGDDAIAKFRALKRKTDPHGILQTDLYQRCFKTKEEKYEVR